MEKIKKQRIPRKLKKRLKKFKRRPHDNILSFSLRSYQSEFIESIEDIIKAQKNQGLD